MGESPWRGVGGWTDGSLHREVLFVDVGGTAVYASLYAPAQVASASIAVVICQSWGTEADQSSKLAHGLALETVKRGGAACLPGYPGYGDSGGDLRTATLQDLIGAVCACVEAQPRLEAPDRILVGIRLGAAVAVRAAERLGARRLLLIQPALDVPAYFHDLARRSRRGTLGVGGMDGFAFGYPLPDKMQNSGVGEDEAAVTGMLPGKTAVIRHAEPPLEPPLPDVVEDIVVPGAWGLGDIGRDLYGTAVDWIRRAAATNAAGELRP